MDYDYCTTLYLRTILFIRSIRKNPSSDNLCGKIVITQYPTASSLSCRDTKSDELGHGFGHGPSLILPGSVASVWIPERAG